MPFSNLLGRYQLLVTAHAIDLLPDVLRMPIAPKHPLVNTAIRRPPTGTFAQTVPPTLLATAICYVELRRELAS